MPMRRTPEELADERKFSTPGHRAKWVEKVYAQIEKENQRKLSKLHEYYNIPKMFLDAELEDFSKLRLGEVRKDPVEKSLFLTGPRGTGKTRLMVALFKEYFRVPGLQYYCSFYRASDLLRQARDCFKPDPEITESEFYDSLCEDDALFIDDLGTTKVTEWALELLSSVLDYRYSNILPTIISSNLKLEEIEIKFDDRVASRIAGMCEVIVINGDDRRLKC